MFESLFKPKSIAVIGASRTPGKVGYEILKNLKEGGFEGDLVPVNPNADEIEGLKCYHHIGDYKGEVDCGIITVPSKLVESAIKDLVSSGVKTVVVITAGFKEIGKDGASLERKLADICRERGVRMLGPNVVGLINTHNRMNASFALSMPKKGSISVLAQSGALCTVIIDWAKGRGIGLSKLISIGNKADLTEVELLQALAEDEQTRVIAGYLEDVIRGSDFIKAAEQAAAVKPVVLLKAGTTKAGQKAASSHTGSLAGEDIAYGAAFKRAGVIRAETFEQLLDFSTAFSMQPLPKGNRVAIVTNAGGLGIIAADAVENSGLAIADLSPETIETLRPRLPAAASLANPVDMLGDSSPEICAFTVKTLQKDPGVDAVVLLFGPQAMSKPVETAEAVAEAVDGNKPVLTAFMGGQAILPAREKLVASNIPDYFSAERAIDALKAMVSYSKWRNRPPRIVTRFPVNRRRVERIITRHVRIDQKDIGEADAKQILAAYAFTVPEGRVAKNAKEAVETAERIGYPVAMKIHSPDILHKSDFDGVSINLGTPRAVCDAFDLMMLRIPMQVSHARLKGVYIEKMAQKGREVILGMTRDSHFGPMLMFGLGGIFVEVMKDVTFHLAPITAEEAMQMLENTRSYALLKEGARGQAGVNLSSIADGLQRISQLVTDFPQISELDINPLMVGKVGTEAVVVDARISLSIEGKR
jgi:acetyltransferase